MTDDLLNRIIRTREAINDAQYIIIGAGAGLSDAAGLKYSGIRFSENFQPFIKRYGMTDMYSAGFYPFKTQEEKWGYWAKHVLTNRYDDSATQLYKDLLELICHKDYFVITTNVDSLFYKAGFESEKLFAVQGDYGMLQCANACHDKLYPNETEIKQMVENTKECKIPTELVPECPICGGQMDINIRKDNYFVEDENWSQANTKYNKFLQKAINGKLVLLELGVGFNTPGIIRYPFENLTYKYKNTTLIRMNNQQAVGSIENTNKTIAFQEDITSTVKQMLSNKQID